MAEILAELFPAVIWKTKLINDEIEYLAEESSKQRDEESVCFLLAACSK